MTTKQHYLTAFWVTLTFALALAVGGFLVPPRGQLDGSVMTIVGLIFLWPALAFANKALEEGHNAHIQAGNASIDIGHHGDDK